MTDRSLIRNFSIIAHIDHGKSTLSDRLIELCDAVPQREMESQLLDNMDLERERGITIKPGPSAWTTRRRTAGLCPEPDRHPGPCGLQLRGVPLPSRLRGSHPGGGLLPGVEAQTLANTYLALEADLEILPYSTKSTCPPPTPSGPSRRWRTSSACRPGRAGDLRQAGRQYPRGAGGHRPEHPRPPGRSQCAPEGPDL